MIHTILIPLDGSALSERALPLASELAQRLNARLVLVCVAGSASGLDSSFTAEDRQAIAAQYSGVTEENHLLSTHGQMAEHAQGQMRVIAEAERYLANVAARMAEQGVVVEETIPYGEATRGILTEIDLRSVDLVVMSTHGRTGLNRLISGSVAQELLARSPVPVLLVPPQRQ
jgi:nucleotide-binding universal stress UspA family protein